MSDQTKGGIAWTDETWNPVRGCSRVSPGCEACYAERQAARMAGPGQAYDGLVRLGKNGPRWTGVVRMVPEKLADPLRWKKPRRVFVNSMSDVFHERLANEEIAAMFGVMAAAPQHTFQVLTKRAERMREWFEWLASVPCAVAGMELERQRLKCHHEAKERSPCFAGTTNGRWWGYQWPLPNVWLGVSVEDQATADERIPLLLGTPATVRFVSFEPALGPVDFWGARYARGGGLFTSAFDWDKGVNWIIVGGESGPGARPFDIAWARAAVGQCKAAGVPCFVKQLGANCVSSDDRDRFLMTDRKGGDPNEWPADLRVREFPK